jgi:hypothetical protein
VTLIAPTADGCWFAWRCLGGQHSPTLIIFEFVGDKFVGGIGNGQPAAGVGRRPGQGVVEHVRCSTMTGGMRIKISCPTTALWSF